MFDIRKLVNGECRLVFYISVTKYLHLESTEQCLASSELLISHPPPHPVSVSSPRTKGGRGVVGGGSIFRKTPDIGLALFQYNPSTISTM